MLRDVRVLYIACMADDTLNISILMDRRDTARDRFFAHRDPGNLTPPQRLAFKYTNMAFLLLFKAAQTELEAEIEMLALLEAETAHE